MSKMVLHVEKCKGCKYCVKACPKQAISESAVYNKKGYAQMQVDTAKCVLCGACYTVCPDYVYEIVE